MKLPGLTAEVSIYQTANDYRTTGAVVQVEARVRPALGESAPQLTAGVPCCSRYFANPSIRQSFINASNYYNNIWADCHALGACNSCYLEYYNACFDAIVCDGNRIEIVGKWWSENNFSCWCNRC